MQPNSVYVLFNEYAYPHFVALPLKKIKLGLFNAGSLATKHDELHIAVDRLQPDILAINETWLSAGGEAHAPKLSGYRLRHSPRPRTVKAGRGGGVGFYIRNGIVARVCVLPNTAPVVVEQMWLLVNVNSTKLMIGTAYRPPWLNLDAFLTVLTETIATFTNYDKIVLLGDFNVNMLECNSSKYITLTQFLYCFDLTNVVSQPTHFTSHSESLIDLVCTNANVQNTCVDYIPDLGAHALVTVTFKINKPKVIAKNVWCRSLKNICQAQLDADLVLCQFNKLFQTTEDVNAVVSVFTERLLNVFEQHAPIRKISIRQNLHPWFTDNIRLMMKLRDEAHNKYRKNKSKTSYDYYHSLKNLVSVSLYYEKKSYLEFSVNQNIHNAQKLWTNLKQDLLPSFKAVSDLPEHFDNPNSINEHFLTIPTSNDNIPISYLTFFEFSRHTDISGSDTTLLKLTTVNQLTISKIISSISSNAEGCDRLSRNMFVLTLPYTLEFVTRIINMSILTSTFPNNWKTALVTPIPKTSNPEVNTDLRPISILPYLSKILEKVVYRQVLTYCEAQGILPKFQSGFRQGHCTASALLDVVDNILAAQDDGKGTILCLLDFTRAFDCIDKNLLLSKLTYYGFDISTVKWFHSYLSDRFQQVVLRKPDGTSMRSDLSHVTKGVPQGSILGPLLFVIFAADITKCLQYCSYHLYADDLQIYISSKPGNASQAIRLLNEDISRICDWCTLNQLKINPKKSKYMILGSSNQLRDYELHDINVLVDDKPIERVFEVRNLGLVMDSNLTFERHVMDVVKNCFFRLKVLYQFRRYVSVDVRKRLCDALIMSKINYCINVYGPCLLCKTQNMLQRVQNACARYCFPILPRSHVTPHLNKHNMLNILNREKLMFATMLFGVINSGKPKYLYEKLSWRKSHRTCSQPLVVPHHKTMAFRGSFRYQATKCWNNIPPPMRLCKTVKVLKIKFSEHLLMQQKQLVA